MKRKRGSRRSILPAKPASFFKVILSGITSGSRLMIPPKFTSACGNDLKDLVFLRVPGGEVWQVKLERTSGEVWFQDGWPEFGAYYSICFGNFLVFRYVGNSTFCVIIMDKSGAEIEYPSLSKEYQKRTEAAEANDNVRSMEKSRNSCPSESDDMVSAPNHVPIKKTEKVSACVVASNPLGLKENASVTSNKRRIKDTDKPHNTCSLKVSIKSVNLHADGSAQEARGKGGNRLTWVTSEADKARMPVPDKAFESNTSFQINMRPSYVSDKFNLTVPRKFVTKYITLDHCKVILQRSDGRSWAVQCDVYPTTARFGVGWRIFVEDNSLAVGDVCLFELINCSENLLKVKDCIKPENLHSDGSTQEDRGKGGNRLTQVTSEADKARMLASAKAFKSKTYFQISMQSAYVSRGFSLNVPRQFVTEYITQDHCKVILEHSDGRSWAVQCDVYRTSAKFGVGWRKFVEDNSLGVGDVCGFELINCSENLLKVSIYKAIGAPSF